MANKKKIQEREQAAHSKRSQRIIQWVAGGMIAIVLITIIIWLAMGRSNTETLTATEVPPAVQAPQETAEPQTASKQYDAYPPITIDESKKYFAKFVMENGGEFTVELYPDEAPLTVNSFVFLAREGFFDGVTFHRVLEGFMAQGGDPTGTGMGGPGYEFVNEDSDLKFDKAGVVAMANAGRDTNGSQFFITFAPAEFLNGDYTIFGQVTEGMDVVNGITLRDPEQFPDYTGDAIKTIVITEE
jgi:cyclophilin family peptidyl-prolyl cis-trans isomerase